MSTVIRISTANLAEVKSLYLVQNKKIPAIKFARNKGLAFLPGETEGQKPSLRDAKHAVESLEEGVQVGNATFTTFPRVAGVILDTGEGRVMVDLDGLQLQLLGDLRTLPMDVIGPSLEMLQYLREWGETHK